MPASLSAIASMFTSAAGQDVRKRTGAARDFEALLIGMMLHSMRENGSGWLGTGDDDASASALGLGEEHLAEAIAAGGGLGLSKLIEQGLARREDSESAPVRR